MCAALAQPSSLILSLSIRERVGRSVTKAGKTSFPPSFLPRDGRQANIAQPARFRDEKVLLEREAGRETDLAD